jgi:hypothetical protein
MTSNKSRQHARDDSFHALFVALRINDAYSIYFWPGPVEMELSEPSYIFYS